MDGDDLIINGEIVLSGTVLPHEYCEWSGGGCFSDRMVRDALSQFDGAVTVRINSEGGSPHVGEAIRAMLAARAADITVVVEGLAASAASLLIMGAGHIEMSAGSILMIHDPSVCVCGNEEDLLREAGVLGTMADVYAQVYAGRAGMSQDEVRTLMRAETFMGPQEALDAGFVDAIESAASETSMTVAIAAQMVGQAQNRLQMCFQHFNSPAPSGATTAANGGMQSAMSATTMESNMDPEDQVEAGSAGALPATGSQAPAATMQAPTPTPAQVDVHAIQMAERQRIVGIRTMAAPFMASGQVSEISVQTLIDDGTTVDNAGSRLMATMAASEPVGPTAAPSAAGANRVGQEQVETDREGMISALMRDYSGPGQQYRGLGLRGLAMHLAGSNRGFNEVDAIRRGIRSTTMMGGAMGVSDFAFITTEVMNRTLQAEYQRRPQSWRRVTGAPQTARDFRELHSVRLGGDFMLKEVKESGEYHQSTIDDEAEGLKVARYGRGITLTFEAIINDDLGALSRLIGNYALAAATLEARMVWSLIRANAKLKSDSKALFHADHGNLAGSGAAISVASVGLGRKSMWERTAFGSKDADDFLNIEPNLLVVPPALETTALQFATATTPVKDSETNPFKGTLEPLVVPNLGAVAGGSDAAWYLFSEDMPPINFAYLEGYEAPTIQTVESMNPDNVQTLVRHICGAAPAEFRGSYKNAGA
ncbi:MAG: head maturation protease, ClpP-related [Pseudoruegeria sp.]